MKLKIETAKSVGDVRGLFDKQLETAYRSDGDYLKGKSVEEMSKIYLENILKQFPGSTLTLEQATAAIEQKVEDIAAHNGEARLFFKREVEEEQDGKKTISVEIVGVWESELEKLVGLKYLSENENSGFPRFIMHDLT